MEKCNTGLNLSDLVTFNLTKTEKRTNKIFSRASSDYFKNTFSNKKYQKTCWNVPPMPICFTFNFMPVIKCIQLPQHTSSR